MTKKNCHCRRSCQLSNICSWPWASKQKDFITKKFRFGSPWFTVICYLPSDAMMYSLKVTKMALCKFSKQKSCGFENSSLKSNLNFNIWHIWDIAWWDILKTSHQICIYLIASPIFLLKKRCFIVGWKLYVRHRMLQKKYDKSRWDKRQLFNLFLFVIYHNSVYFLIFL